MINKYDNLKKYHPKYTPVKHRRKVPFNPNINVTSDFTNRVQRIRELDYELDRFVLTEKDYAELVLDAYSTNIHWSTKMEGNPLSQAEVRRVTRRTLVDGNIETDAGPNQEIINHLLIFLDKELTSHEWTKEFICYLHRILLMNTQSKAKIGEYRKGDCIIEEEGGPVFSTCPPSSIEEEMNSLIEWVNRKGPAYDPIVTASTFFHEFESIHPFEDGNGRLGRSLFHIYLINHGLKKSNLCKIDYELLSHSSLYYNILAYTDESQDYTPLTELFSIAVLHSYENAVSSLTGKDLLSNSMDENSKRLITKAKQRSDWFSIKEAATWLDAIGEQTIRTRLNELVEMGVLETKGKTKGLRFKFKVPFSKTIEAIKSLDYYGSQQTE